MSTLREGGGRGVRVGGGLGLLNLNIQRVCERKCPSINDEYVPFNETIKKEWFLKNAAMSRNSRNM